MSGTFVPVKSSTRKKRIGAISLTSVQMTLTFVIPTITRQMERQWLEGHPPLCKEGVAREAVVT